jgi:hypothetical protein
MPLEFTELEAKLLIAALGLALGRVEDLAFDRRSSHLSERYQRREKQLHDLKERIVTSYPRLRGMNYCIEFLPEPPVLR